MSLSSEKRNVVLIATDMILINFIIKIKTKLVVLSKHCQIKAGPKDASDYLSNYKRKIISFYSCFYHKGVVHLYFCNSKMTFQIPVYTLWSAAVTIHR